MNPLKDGGVDFTFLRGQELSNAQGLLENRDRKQVSSLQFQEIEEIPLEALYEILQEAILLDETVPYKLKRKRK